MKTILWSLYPFSHYMALNWFWLRLSTLKYSLLWLWRLWSSESQFPQRRISIWDALETIILTIFTIHVVPFMTSHLAIWSFSFYVIVFTGSILTKYMSDISIKGWSIIFHEMYLDISSIFTYFPPILSFVCIPTFNCISINRSNPSKALNSTSNLIYFF